MVKRGDVIYLKNSAYLEAIGHIQGGYRPMIVVSNDIGNKHSKLVICVPLTTNKTRIDFPTHVLVNNENSVALCEQIFTINQNAIDRVVGHINGKEMQALNKCLMVSLGVTV